jgi:hypothetical protein
MNIMNIKKLIVSLTAVLAFSVTSASADGHIKYSVTADNVSEYSAMLTPGMINMFSAYPDTFRMDVYESGGRCTMDSSIMAISQSNGTMINDNEGLELPNMGQIPFPDPSHAQHFVWNYRMFAGSVSAVDRIQTSARVTADGAITTGQQETTISFPVNPNTKTMYADKNIFALFMQKT